MIHETIPIAPKSARARTSSVILAAVATLACFATFAPPALGWEFVDAMTAYGDRATGIVQPARDDPDTVLAVGCDGDRWRMVVIAPRNPRGINLGPDPGGEVSFSFGSELGAPGKWQVRKRSSGEAMLVAPEPTNFVSLLVREERKSPDAALRVGVRSRGKKVVLEFPLTGLRAAIRRDLWKPCKLENYFPEAEGTD